MADLVKHRMKGAILFLALLLGAASPAEAAGRKDGDLDGVWTLGSFTDLQRPKELKTLVLTPAEAEAYEAPRRALGGMVKEKDGAGVGQSESEFNERGARLMRVSGQIRSSWIIEPADGQMPYTAQAKAKFGIGDTNRVARNTDPEDLNMNTRCLTSSATGAPMIGAPDTNLFQIVQAPAQVAILTEKYHDVRVVQLNAEARPARAVSDWLGWSAGRWEGQTLVVETEGFRPGYTQRGGGLYLSEHSRVIERFQRIGRNQLRYQFSVEDPTLFTEIWRAEAVLDRAQGRIFEYACHEGNYSLPNILAGARQQEQAGAADTKP